uniref:Uncharacterized protein n=1 Tax=Anguilla anguilla TaxID=7936 RepID=A0A0E9SPM4_ANGAN
MLTSLMKGKVSLHQHICLAESFKFKNDLFRK